MKTPHILAFVVVALVSFLAGVFAIVALVTGPIKSVFEQVLDNKFPETYITE